MTVSSADTGMTGRPARRALTAILFAAAVMSATGGAQAQSSGPIQLFPGAVGSSADPAPVTKEVQAGPGAVTPAVSTQPFTVTSPPPAATGRDGIVVTDVVALSPDAVGTLSTKTGGLQQDMWTGTSRTAAVRLLSALPVTALSPARQEIAARLLLSAAQPPAGAGQPTLLELRLSALLTMGQTEAVRTLAKGITGPGRTEAVERAVVDSLLIDGRLDEACKAVEGGLAAYPGSYWQKASAFCLYRSGRTEQANIQVTLLREDKVDDPAFLWAAEQMSGLKGPALSGFQKPSPLTVAMIRETGRPYPNGTLTDAAPWMTRAIVLGTKTDPSVRFSAGQMAVAGGSLSAAELVALYTSTGFNDADYARPVTDLVNDGSGKAAAVMYQMVLRQTAPAQKAEWIARAMDQAVRTGQEMVVAQVYAPLVRDLQPDPSLTGFLPVAVRILLGAGLTEDAQRWVRLGQDLAGRGDASAAAQLDSVWLLRRLAVPSGLSHWSPQEYENWRAAMTRSVETRLMLKGSKVPTTQMADRLQARGIALLQATGEAVSADDWALLWGGPAVDEAKAPSAARSSALSAAVLNKRLAEGVALSLLVQDTAPTAQVSDVAVAQAVESLRRLGQDPLSRRLAIEAALSAGL